MNECLLCKRDMKVSDDIFGKGCVKNIYLFLDMPMPKKIKLREVTLYKNIMRKTNTHFNKNKSQYEKDYFKALQYAFWQTVIEVGENYGRNTKSNI